MKNTYLAIRRLLELEDKSRISVSAMPLVRIQLEPLFATSLIVEQPQTFPLYLKDGWKRLYVRHLWFHEESKALPRIREGLKHVEPSLEAMRKRAGVTDEEKLTIESEELGSATPPGFQPKPIRWFPTPGDVLDRIKGPERKKMLARLLPEYEFLCSFVTCRRTRRCFQQSLILGSHSDNRLAARNVPKGDRRTSPVGWDSLVSYRVVVSSCSLILQMLS